MGWATQATAGLADYGTRSRIVCRRDILILALLFARGGGHHGSTRKIVLGQYLGFAAILALAAATAFDATFLPEGATSAPSASDPWAAQHSTAQRSGLGGT